MTKDAAQDHDRIAAAKAFLLQSFKTACLAHQLSETEAAVVLAKLFADLTAVRTLNASLPIEAPERWADRTGRKENPPAFIRRVYADYIGRGLTRPLLGALDKKLYQALAVWEHRKPFDRMTEIPGKSEARNDILQVIIAHCTQAELETFPPAPRSRLCRARPEQPPQP